MLNYIKSLFATAPVKVEKKNALMRALKIVLYAQDETTFYQLQENLLKEMTNAKTGMSHHGLLNPIR